MKHLQVIVFVLSTSKTFRYSELSFSNISLQQNEIEICRVWCLGFFSLFWFGFLVLFLEGFLCVLFCFGFGFFFGK